MKNNKHEKKILKQKKSIKELEAILIERDKEIKRYKLWGKDSKTFKKENKKYLKRLKQQKLKNKAKK